MIDITLYKILHENNLNLCIAAEEQHYLCSKVLRSENLTILERDYYENFKKQMINLIILCQKENRRFNKDIKINDDEKK